MTMKIFVAIGVILFVAISGVKVASAASLYFSPSSGSYAVGQNFSVGVYVSSPDQAMNAASGAISFPQDKLEIVSFSKSGSIIGLWVQEPSFSNGAGAMNFEGIVLNPGFTGKDGKIITINFRVKDLGLANISFSSGSVLANDGKGTNILSNLGNAQFSLNPATTGPQASESTTPSLTAGVPLAPRISSPTNPDPEKWYSNPNPKFVWSVPDGITAARILYNKYPTSLPTVLYSPPISEKQLENIKDGVWYFHVQFKNAQGWGAISHFRFQIDTQPPEPFSVKFIDGQEPKNPRPTVIFDTEDVPSGIDYYKIKIGEGDFFAAPVAMIKSNPYTLPLQGPGKRTILVQAFDKAGNYAIATEEFVIKPIEAPIIDKYPEELTEGEALKIEGKTYPEATITIFLKSDTGKIISQEVMADANGGFSVVWQNHLTSGVYGFWAEATDKRGAKSEKTPLFTVVIKQAAFLRIGSLVISYVTAIISILVIGFALFFLGWYLWYRFALFKKKGRKEVRETEQALHKSFNFLRKSVRDHLKLLEQTKSKRELTETEEKITKQLKEDLDKAEESIAKELKDVDFKET